MIVSVEIEKRQNEEKILKVQHAARCLYNSAEKLNNYVWFFCLVSTFSVFIPPTWPVYASYGIPFVANLVAATLLILATHKVKTAAILRKFFDSYVLDIYPSQFTETELRKIWEHTEKVYSTNPDNAKVQMAHTGEDSPPGIRDWYIFPEPLNDISAKFECQRQNAWWNSKLIRNRFITIVCTSVVVGVTFIILAVKNNLLTTILYSAGLITKIVERLIENGRYLIVSMKINGAIQVLEKHPTEEGIAVLQNFFDERRAIVVLESNTYYKKAVNKISALYKNIISKK